MASLKLDITLKNSTHSQMSSRVLTKAARHFLAYLNIEGACLLDLELVSAHKIQTINKRFRRIDAPTDVLSFPIHDSVTSTHPKPSTPNPLPTLLGSIVICPEIVKRRFQEGMYGAINQDQSMIYVLAHSLMHLLGHHHDTDQQNATFENRLINFLKSHTL